MIRSCITYIPLTPVAPKYDKSNVAPYSGRPLRSRSGRPHPFRQAFASPCAVRCGETGATPNRRKRSETRHPQGPPSPEKNIFNALFISGNNAPFPQSAFMTNIFHFRTKATRKYPEKAGRYDKKPVPVRQSASAIRNPLWQTGNERPLHMSGRPSISIRRNDQPKCPFRSRYSAICTAFSAAPLRIWSLTHQNVSEFGSARSLRIRPTYTASTPAKGSGIG